MNIRIGDKVRSYDFKGIKDSYIEGCVYDIIKKDGCDRYMIFVTKKVVQGNEINHKIDYVYPPANGTLTLFGDVANGVELTE